MCVSRLYLQPFFSYFNNFDLTGCQDRKSAKCSSNIVKIGTKRSVCHAPWVRNHTSYDCHLWYTSVKWEFLHELFLFFSKLWFLGLLGGSKSKNGSKWQKTVSAVPLYLRKHTLYDLHLWYTCVKDNNSTFFLRFFKILISMVKSRVKDQKMSQDDKKLCLSHSISQEAYILWSSFLVSICKMMTSPDIFFVFSKF